MRCTHAEKLIPLYAGDDLPAQKTDALRRHLESCANCRRLAAEFEESRDWLRGFPAPKFDEAMLDDMRDSVLRGIGRVENRSPWFQWIVPGLNMRFAVSMAALLLIAFFAAYVYRGSRPQMAPDKESIVDKNQGGDHKNSNGRRDVEEHDANPSTVPKQHPPRKQMAGNRKNRRDKQVQAPDRLIAHAAPFIELPPNGGLANNNAIFNREMTRLEFQTADPNIRIIWLTPKDSNSNSTKPNTNVR